MGQLIYDSQPLELRLDDRALTHLQIVIVNLIRRGESFVFSWKDDPAVGGGRSSIWIHPYCGLHFKFAGGKSPSVNRSWLDELYASAASGSGLVLSPEPTDAQGPVSADDVAGAPPARPTTTISAS
ncbi:ATP-dependent DNA ligase [Curtobacterium flaccumfaciens pv. flaccumfaciens]|uniref:DUF7882 family protein n=1 Tax=Curtobacterium flaccumfaciens TaxID=2035 RepID=UPI001BDEA0F0|nr:ATP-dependent DNA ligase [Curtobacterium flaccumfaciens]MBT1670385.1 ATP-dependent DNA ligase [Curtobacterium flaccumfaciens pv. flaccumfaciens]